MLVGRKHFSLKWVKFWTHTSTLKLFSYYFHCGGYSVDTCQSCRFFNCIISKCITSWALLHPVLFSLSSCICTVACHLGTLDVRRVELKDKVRAEPEDYVWWTYPEDGWISMCMIERGCSSSEYHLTNTNLVLIPGKPRSITSIFSIQCYYLIIVH